MYNLLMSGLDTAFDQSPWELEKGRFGEYTDEDILLQFDKLDETAIDTLLSLPALFWYERANQKGARVGWLEEIKPAGRNLQIKFAFDPFVPEIPFPMVIELAPNLDIGMGKREFEGHRTHWAVKNVDLIGLLHDRRIIDRTQISPQAPYSRPKRSPRDAIQVRPQFFEVPDQPIDRKLVAVMMPFSPPFHGVYGAIHNAAQNVGLHAQKADDIWNHSVLIQDIFGLIYRSHIVVCDFTGKNPNVFYEAGIAHMLGRHVVPITQSHEDVPFDLRHHRYIPYLNNGEGLAGLTAQLAPRLATLAGS
ncbi:hypothetical protein HJB84_02705 [Rhizobium sp. NZLR1b]|uniref:hypothetical protein n=1 Tax=Rhizobium sp. NZLR1b TaxID=2731099 RepID=UPI002180A1E9|nr:hypothetical protein [Rhizobium sp. NZLR1b]MBX5168776.1 hypothetical protein [Rhizobium sp. NZLR1b]